MGKWSSIIVAAGLTRLFALCCVVFAFQDDEDASQDACISQHMLPTALKFLSMRNAKN